VLVLVLVSLFSNYFTDRHLFEKGAMNACCVLPRANVRSLVVRACAVAGTHDESSQ
jgi:hypothetical protein